MNVSRRFSVDPGISHREMEDLWDEAVRMAMDEPGVTIGILFSPGTYPLPEPGTFVYKNNPTRMHVPHPGFEMRLTYVEEADQVEIAGDQLGETA